MPTREYHLVHSCLIMYRLYNSAAAHNDQSGQSLEHTVALASTQTVQPDPEPDCPINPAIASALCAYRTAAFKTEAAFEELKGTAQGIGRMAQAFGNIYIDNGPWV